MSGRRNNVLTERAAIRADVARMVATVGADGRNTKESLSLAAERSGLSPRRCRAFHAKSADAWAWEFLRLRRLQAEYLRRQVAKLEHEAETARRQLVLAEMEDV